MKEDKIGIFFIHPKVNNIREFIDYFKIEDSTICKNLKWDKILPSVIFVSELIYNNINVYRSFRLFYKKRPEAVFVFHGGESVEPDLNIFDYAIITSSTLKESERIVRFPPSLFYRNYIPKEKNELTYQSAIDRVTKSNLKFCNYIYSNPNAHPYRDSLFYRISEYKHVDSLGGHLNNTKTKCTRSKQDWALISIIQKSGYKFSIACENEIFNGYTTEKLLTSFQAHTVPIYWGNPLVFEEYNEEAFINCHNYDDDLLIKKIKEIDNNDELWAKMVSAPWRTKVQQEKYNTDVQIYQCFIKGILLNCTQKRPSGTFTDMYYRWFFRNFKPEPFHTKILWKVNRRISLLKKTWKNRN